MISSQQSKLLPSLLHSWDTQMYHYKAVVAWRFNITSPEATTRWNCLCTCVLLNPLLRTTAAEMKPYSTLWATVSACHHCGVWLGYRDRTFLPSKNGNPAYAFNTHKCKHIEQQCFRICLMLTTVDTTDCPLIKKIQYCLGQMLGKCKIKTADKCPSDTAAKPCSNLQTLNYAKTPSNCSMMQRSCSVLQD